MATDPIQRVRAQTHDVPLTFGVREALAGLAALPPSLDVPYLTVSLDWTPEGSAPGREPPPDLRRSEMRSRRGETGASRRPSRREFEREMERILADYGPRGDAFDSLSRDTQRIGEFLDDELDPAAQGVFIVSCSAHDVFTPLALSVPLPTTVTAAPTPALSLLARIVDDYPAYAVLLADQHEATISKIRRGARGRSVRLESNDWPRKQQTGGLSQRRLQARAGERVAAFARGIAEETERTLDDAAIDMLVVAGDPVITSALAEAFSKRVADRIIGTLNLDIQTSEQAMIEATLPLVEQVERDQELAAARAVADEVGADARGAAGAGAVLRALQGGRVANLVMVDDFAGEGWADYGRDLYGIGPIPESHPVGGDVAEIVPVALEEELIRLALRTGAEIEIIHTSVPIEAAENNGSIPPAGAPHPRPEAATILDQFGGVGALLRFTLG
jgi:peptide subunit release factor 1 (eRF1)